MENIKRGFTHGGSFHSDDVFSTALLKYLFPNIEITRGFDVPENYDGIVYDIGFGEYDHHQKDKRIRENGVPYAAFGLLWDKFGTRILSEEAAKRFDETFIQQLDYSDNTGERNIMADAIGSFNPDWDSSEDKDEAFKKAVEVAYEILSRRLNVIKSAERAEKLVNELVEKNEDKEYLILPKYTPWKKVICGTESIIFVIYPSNRGGYNVQGVPMKEETNDLRCPFPEKWRGASEEAIRAESGIEGIRFCHTSGFLIAVNNIETAIKACEYTLENGK